MRIGWWGTHVVPRPSHALSRRVLRFDRFEDDRGGVPVYIMMIEEPGALDLIVKNRFLDGCRILGRRVEPRVARDQLQVFAAASLEQITQFFVVCRHLGTVSLLPSR
jgi:hypothetical protein